MEVGALYGCLSCGWLGMVCAWRHATVGSGRGWLGQRVGACQLRGGLLIITLIWSALCSVCDSWASCIAVKWILLICWSTAMALNYYTLYSFLQSRLRHALTRHGWWRYRLWIFDEEMCAVSLTNWENGVIRCVLWWSTWVIWLHLYTEAVLHCNLITDHFSGPGFCLQCFDTIGLASGRASGLSDEVLAWLCVWSEAQMICIWSSWCCYHPIISCFIKIRIGLTFLVPAYLGCPRKEGVFSGPGRAVGLVSVCVCVCLSPWRTITFKWNDLWHRYLAHLFTLTLKVMFDGRMKVHVCRRKM